MNHWSLLAIKSFITYKLAIHQASLEDLTHQLWSAIKRLSDNQPSVNGWPYMVYKCLKLSITICWWSKQPAINWQLFYNCPTSIDQQLLPWIAQPHPPSPPVPEMAIPMRVCAYAEQLGERVEPGSAKDRRNSPEMRWFLVWFIGIIGGDNGYWWWLLLVHVWLTVTCIDIIGGMVVTGDYEVVQRVINNHHRDTNSRRDIYLKKSGANSNNKKQCVLYSGLLAISGHFSQW